MKKLVLILFLLATSMEAFSQNTITFLGIPVTGTKREMGAKLQGKGFVYDSYSDLYYGEFNGQDVKISIQTVNNRVWRIGIMDAYTTDRNNISIRYNKLFDQFLNNGKYYLGSGQKLTDYDIQNLEYHVKYANERHDAVFYPKNSSINGRVWYMIGYEALSYRIFMYYENNDNAANGDDL